MKRKPIRFDDVYLDGKENPEVVTRNYHRSHGVATYTGQVPVVFTCPFCSQTVRTWLWSLSGSGKRCPYCKAIFGSLGQGHQWKDKVS